MSERKIWNGTIWEFNKSQSNWHFDKSRVPELGDDSYTPICIFDYDFSKEIEICVERMKFTKTACLTDVLNLFGNVDEKVLFDGADSNTEIFTRVYANDIPAFKMINDYLGLVDSAIFFHYQTTGQLAPLHVDNFANRDDDTDKYDVECVVNSNTEMSRIVIMLAEWELGQAWMFGNAVYTGWKAGTCITWDWRNMPHGTVNAGWHPRPILQITGKHTPRTNQILELAKGNLGKPLQSIAL